MKRLRAAAPGPVGDVERVRRNLAMADGHSELAPADAADKCIRDMVNERSHIQFHNMDVARCKHYLSILNVTPLQDSAGLKKLKAQLFESLSGAIFREVGNLDKANKILHHHGIPTLKKAPSVAPVSSPPPPAPDVGDSSVELVNDDLESNIESNIYGGMQRSLLC